MAEKVSGIKGVSHASELQESLKPQEPINMGRTFPRIFTRERK